MRPEGFHEDLSVTLSFNPIIPVPPLLTGWTTRLLRPLLVLPRPLLVSRGECLPRRFYSSRSLHQHAESWIDDDDRLHIDTGETREVIDPR